MNFLWSSTPVLVSVSACLKSLKNISMKKVRVHNVTLEADLNVGILPPRLSTIDAKKSDWTSLFQAPGHSHNPPPEVEEETVPDEPKEPLPGLILYSTFLLTDLSDVLKTIKISTDPLCILPRGLSNPDNKCFLNSVLQSFIYCSPFCRFLTDLTRAQINKQECPFLSKLYVSRFFFSEKFFFFLSLFRGVLFSC